MRCVREITGEDSHQQGFVGRRSPVILICGGKLKSVVYANNPHDLVALKQNIREEIYNIRRELQQFSRNPFERIQTCLTAEGRHLNIYDSEHNINYYT
jgi:hypothetical protein